MSLTITVDFYNVIAKWLIWTWNLLIHFIFSYGCSSTCDLLWINFRFMRMNAVIDFYDDYWGQYGWGWGQIFFFRNFLWNFYDSQVEFKVWSSFHELCKYFNFIPFLCIFKTANAWSVNLKQFQNYMKIHEE